PRHLFLAAPHTLETYTLSLHDALPICRWRWFPWRVMWLADASKRWVGGRCFAKGLLPITVAKFLTSPGSTSQTRLHSSRTSTIRSEEHTSELQSRENLVWRLQLENKQT